MTPDSVAGALALTTQAPMQAGTLVGVPISLNVSGSYEGVLAPLNGLQRGERTLSVTSFDTTQVAETDAVIGTISVVVQVPTGAAAGSSLITRYGTKQIPFWGCHAAANRS